MTIILKNKPQYLYNCDKTFLPLDHSREKAVTRKNAKSSSYGTSEHYNTIVLCISSRNTSGIHMASLAILGNVRNLPFRLSQNVGRSSGLG